MAKQICDTVKQISGALIWSFSDLFHINIYELREDNVGYALRIMHRINPQGTSKAKGQPDWIYDDTAIWIQRFDWTKGWLCMWLLSLRGGPRQLDNTQRNAEDGQSHPSESTMRSRIKCNSSAISKEIKSGAQFCSTAQNDLYCTPDRKKVYNVFLSIVTSRAGLFC